MNVRSSIVDTMNQVRGAVHDLQQAGLVAIGDIPVQIEWGHGALVGDPLGGSIQFVLAANVTDHGDRGVDCDFRTDGAEVSRASDSSVSFHHGGIVPRASMTSSSVHSPPSTDRTKSTSLFSANWAHAPIASFIRAYSHSVSAGESRSGMIRSENRTQVAMI